MMSGWCKSGKTWLPWQMVQEIGRLSIVRPAICSAFIVKGCSEVLTGNNQKMAGYLGAHVCIVGSCRVSGHAFARCSVLFPKAHLDGPVTKNTFLHSHHLDLSLSPISQHHFHCLI
jgi:hypothetical protein